MQRSLVSDVLIVRLDGHTINLRPTLWAAARLYQKYGSFAALFTAVSSGSATAMADIVREAAGDTVVSKYLAELDQPPIGYTLGALTEAFARFVLQLAGADADTNAQSSPAGELMTFDDYHAQLFEIATGFLSWSPTDAWNATAAEILAARKGRQSLLAAIFGGKSKDDEIDMTDPTQRAKARAALNALGDLNTVSMSDVP